MIVEMLIDTGIIIGIIAGMTVVVWAVANGGLWFIRACARLWWIWRL